uniref:Putative serine-rich adhesin for platelets-like isoform x1 n=1 Tax=Nyssomyia neivai TaxID=330878 RepID=A0A1L8DD68_9DIPT
MDILDLDEILKDDSFCNLTADQKMDESITNILQQWKQNDVTQGTKGTKLVDTRTFTRPKKRGMLEHEYDHHPGINLQVGGLVTSMRRSLIGETSPPSSFCSSVDSMNAEMMNSLINSGDFNNVSFFMENMEDSASINFNGYKLEDVIKDRHFLETLTSCEDVALSKDASISHTDDHVMSTESSDSNPLIDVTMKLNPNFNGTFVTKDTTFNVSNDIYDPPPAGSETFNLMGDTTIDNYNVRGSSQNATFNCTFGILPEKEVSLGNATCTGDQLLLNQTYTGPLNGSDSKTDQPEKVEKKLTPESKEWCYSTPLKTTKKENHRKINLSPIKCDQTIGGNVSSRGGNFEKYLQEATDHAFTPDKTMEKPRFDLSPDEDIVELRRLPIPINMLREDERQSLKNFEEYEKTLMQDNDREFDDVLNRFATMNIQQSNEKMRQSLDSIKKRHSLVNMEKQQQEEVAKLDADRCVDSNKLSESMGKSRRLLSRRSRIYDEVNSSLNHSAENIDVVAEEKPEERSPVKGNRDRFKTIRIIRPQDENSPRLPDAGDTTVVIEPMEEPTITRNVELERNQTFKKPAPTRNLPRPRYFKSALTKPISYQKFNSADDLLDTEETQLSNTTQTIQSPMGTKSKSIHNLLSGQKSLASMEKLNRAGSDFKSSAETLHKTQSSSKLSLAPSSRFGKSNQFLAPQSSRQQVADVERPRNDTKAFLGNIPNSIGTAAMRNNNTKKLGLVRPSSGYYSYSVRRNDSDTESGRYSPQSLSSSASSNVSEVPQNPDATFDTHQIHNSLDVTKRPGAVVTKVPRPTGLRLPSNFRAGGASALPRPSGIPRR